MRLLFDQGRLAIIALPVTDWPLILQIQAHVVQAIDTLISGTYHERAFPRFGAQVKPITPR